tara:strand:+ start:51 stop:467 length:417 start_codon:yes stop_codon:yes gene_type:complete
MKRVANWEQTFHQFLTDNKDRPFKWGEWDCISFANAAIKSITGEDVIPKALEWRDEKSAKITIKEYAKTLTRCVKKAALLKGFVQRLPEEAQKGDIVIISENKNRLVGICDGYAVVCPSDEGHSLKPKSSIRMVLSIQ